MKKNGFTLAELLGVIVIISILLVLIIPPIINGIKNSEEKVLDTQKQIIYSAADEEMEADKDKYPNKANNTYCIPISELIKNGFLTEDIKDLNTNEPYDKTKIVRITISENKTKSYEIVNQGECNENTTSGLITFSIYPSNKVWSQNKIVTIKYNKPSYSNYYSKNGSPLVAVSGKTAKVKYNANGKIEAQIMGQGEEIYAKENVEKIDTIKPTCSLTTIGQKGQDDWFINDVNIAMTDDDPGETEVKSGVSKRGLTTNTKKTYNNKEKVTRKTDAKTVTYYGYVKDKAGNENQCQTTFKRDVTKPICGFTIIGSKGTNGWYLGEINITSSRFDETSGVKTHGMGLNTQVDYNETQLQKQTADTAGTTHYCYIQDKAGNENMDSIIVKKDTVKPTITLAPNNSATYVKGGRNITLNIADSLSGIPNGQKIYYAWSKSNTTAPSYSNYVTTNNTNGAKTATLTVPANTSKSLSGTYYLWIKSNTLSDMAGNKSNQVISGAYKFDNTPPTIELSTKVATTNNLTINATDNLSGLSGYAITTSTATPSSWTAISGTSFTKSFSKTTGTYYVHIKDVAGNTTYKSIYVKALNPPTCQIKVTGTIGKNSWYTSQAKVEMTTGGGAAAKKGLSTSPSSTNGTTSITNTTEGSNITYYGYVENAAGKSSCTATFKQDTKPPIIYLGITGDGTFITDGRNTTINVPGEYSGVSTYFGFGDYKDGANASSGCGAGFANGNFDYRWDYGGFTPYTGTKSGECNIEYTDTWSGPGNREMTIQVTDQAGLTSSATAYFTIKHPCSASNPTACPSYWPCRYLEGGETAKTMLFDAPNFNAQNVVVYRGTHLYKISEEGNFSYVYATSYGESNPYYSNIPYGYIRSSCITTDPNYKCDYSVCKG